MRYIYTAVFTPEENGMFSVSFPDLPGCGTCGDDIEDAVNMAKDILCLWLYDMEQDKKVIPPARATHNIPRKNNEFASTITVDTETYHRFYESQATLSHSRQDKMAYVS